MNQFIQCSFNQDVEKAVCDATGGLFSPDIVFFFTYQNAFHKTASLLREKYPDANIIGSTGYTFANKDIVKKGLSIFAITGGIKCSCDVIQDLSNYPIKHISRVSKNMKEISAEESSTVCVEFCTGNEENLVSALNAALYEKNISLIGGTAQCIPGETQRLVSLNGEVYEDACVYALIKNMRGRIKVFKEDIYKPIGKHFIATDVDVKNKIIKTLDGSPASQKYINEANVDPSDVLKCSFENPLAKRVGNDIYVSAIAELKENGTIKCHKKINVNDIIEILELDNYKANISRNIERMKGELRTVSAILSVNCVHRYLLFESDNFLSNYAKIMCNGAPHIGLIVDGEQFNKQHVNQTMVCVIFE